MPIKKIELTDIKTSLSGFYDVFICASSFEDRCISIPTSIDADKLGKVLILSNLNYHDYVGLNQRELTNLFGEKGNVVGVKSSDPLFTADAIRNALLDVGGGKIQSILIDVTTFTHEMLLIMLRLLNHYCPVKF